MFIQIVIQNFQNNNNNNNNNNNKNMFIKSVNIKIPQYNVTK